MNHFIHTFHTHLTLSSTPMLENNDMPTMYYLMTTFIYHTWTSNVDAVKWYSTYKNIAVLQVPGNRAMIYHNLIWNRIEMCKFKLIKTHSYLSYHDWFSVSNFQLHTYTYLHILNVWCVKFPCVLNYCGCVISSWSWLRVSGITWYHYPNPCRTVTILGDTIWDTLRSILKI